MQNDLYVFTRLPDNQEHVVGRLLYEQLADGSVRSWFRYELSWLNHPQGFPLDPIHLPLQPEPFQLKSRSGLWGVLEDALPDAWGRRILQARHDVDVGRDNNIALLLLTGWSEPGAAGFASSAKKPAHTVVPMDLKMTEQAITAAEAFEKDAAVLNLPDFFISGGSSAGGARPKVLARSGEDQYLVKFPSINDPAPEIMAQLEFFGMSCARQARIPVPDFFLINTSNTRTALAVQRFDITTDNGRLHFLSFQSLIGIEAQLGLPYSAMAEILRKISVDPEQDTAILYKQMVLNIILCNCDDHLKNFSMLYDPSLQGFRLSPAYDIVPNLWQREHILSVAGKTADISLDDLITEGRLFALSRQHCLRLAQETAQGAAAALAACHTMLHRLSAAHPLCSQLLDDIRKNLDNLNQSLPTEYR